MAKTECEVVTSFADFIQSRSTTIAHRRMKTLVEYKVRIALFVAAAIIVFFGGNPTNGTQTGDAVMSITEYFINYPKTPKELLANIKICLDKNLLLNDAFMNDDVITRFFDGKSIRWHVTPTAKMANMVEFGGDNQNNRDFVLITEVGVSARLIDAKGYETPLGKLSVSAGLGGIYDPRFTMEAVVSVFGAPKEIIDTQIAGVFVRHPMPISPTTNTFGNKTISYALDTNNIKKEIIIRTSGNGSIKLLVFKESER